MQNGFGSFAGSRFGDQALCPDDCLGVVNADCVTCRVRFLQPFVDGNSFFGVVRKRELRRRTVSNASCFVTIARDRAGGIDASVYMARGHLA
jgi:hypothetical protein